MRINKELIAKLASEGIVVTHFACTKEQYLAQREEVNYRRLTPYYRHQDNKYIDGRWVTSYTHTEEQEREQRVEAKRYALKDLDDWYNAQYLYIKYGEGKMIRRKAKTKYGEITEEYIRDLIKREEKLYNGAYGRVAILMRKLLDGNGFNDTMIYPTTYGIGVWAIFNWNLEECKERVAKILDERGVDYSNEFSEAGWVYRFKISQRAGNLKKIA